MLRYGKNIWQWFSRLRYDPRETSIESELKVARDIQFRMMPQKFPPYSE